MVVVSTAVAALICEGAARLLLNPGDFLQVTLVDDPILGHRIAPFAAGHDALGFRNDAVPARADIVAIGDSMTYGVAAPRESSWPRQLGDLLGERVYNMGLGGYGPLQYLHLARDQAASLKPRLVIVGVYLGNDVMDAFLHARARAHWHAWRVSVEAEPALTDYDRAGLAEPRRRLAALRSWLARHSMLYSVIRATLLPGLQAKEQDAMAQEAGAGVRMLWKDASNPAVRTIFTPGLRLAALDLEVQSVREGLQISQKALAALKAQTERQGTQLLVAVIPTKERAFCRRLQRAGEQLPASFVRLCEAESRVNAQLQRFLRAQAIAYVDLTPALEAQIERDLPVYPTDADGHPQAQGYRVIATEIAAAVRRQFPR